MAAYLIYANVFAKFHKLEEGDQFWRVASLALHRKPAKLSFRTLVFIELMSQYIFVLQLTVKLPIETDFLSTKTEER